MRVYVVSKTNGIYNDDTFVVGVYTTRKRAEEMEAVHLKEMNLNLHEGAECDGNARNCADCHELETGGHFVEVEEWEIEK